MQKFLKYLLLFVIIAFFTSCVNNGTDAHQKAIDRIVRFGQIGEPILTVQDYVDAGVIGVNTSNLVEINEVIGNLTKEEIDTTEEIQALADAVGIQISVPVVDTSSPVITLNGLASLSVVQYSTYTDAGATAKDDVDISIRVISRGTVDTSTVNSYTISYSAIDRAGNTAIAKRTVRVTDFLTTHNGTSYSAVVSPYTGKVWLDRNLGATQVCTSSIDTACYGDYYQWGRNFDGHQDAGSAIKGTLASDVNNAGVEFISAADEWASVDTSGMIRSANWSKTDASNICPLHFRVPIKSELQLETIDNGVIDGHTAFVNFLHIPLSGFRDNDGSILEQGDVTYLKTIETASPGFNSSLLIESAKIGFVESEYSYGDPVRCIKD